MANKFSKFYTYNGRTLHLRDWEKESGISSGTLRARLRYGMCFEEAITTPLKDKAKRVPYTVNGLTLPLSTWCQFLGISKQSLQQSAKKYNGTSLSQLIKQIEKNPHLFPHHLLTTPPEKTAKEAADTRTCKVTVAEQAELLATYEARIKELENELAHLTHNV